MANRSFLTIGAIVLFLSFIIAEVESIGVCYGRGGNNLPPPDEVIALYKSNRIGGIRLYDANHDVLDALRDSNISVIIDVPNSELSSLASNPSAAIAWVQSNIKPYSDRVAFRYIAVGNEQIPGSQPQNILTAIQNMQNALWYAGLGRIKASTSISTNVLGTSYPPSASTFSSNVIGTLQPIIAFLAANKIPLLVNVYPYLSYIDNPGHISLDYVLFTSRGIVVTDGQLLYQNLFDAIIDSFYSSLEKVGGGGVRLVVSEIGWPSDGGSVATQANAQTYLSNLIKHVGNGTPKRPGVGIETYIFSIFDENLKQPQGTVNHYGLFNPDKQPKYSLNF